MKKILLLQLPIQKINYPAKCGNIAMGAATLKIACDKYGNNSVDLLDEKKATYFSDSALIEHIIDRRPDIVGFTVFNWNLERSIHISKSLKEIYNPQIVFGGPEITDDNPNIMSPFVDHYITGEGEKKFIELTENIKPAFSIFENSTDPYEDGLLDHKINGTMLLETMRGCPYSCGYCYYNKSKSKLSFRNKDRILNSIEWASDNGVEELYLLDPSLNVRPDLKELLIDIAEVNSKKKVLINSELRADKINKIEADLFMEAGFNGFETGLQTTNDVALKIMNRKTDLKRFVKGINLLKERNIVPRIDLILGLPGDTYDGFQNSILFVNENDMADDLQVFPLSVLPGTDFRKNSEKLGLNYEKEPPYTVISNDTFSKDEMLLAIDNTENLFDMALFPLPDLNLSLNSDINSDVKVSIEGDILVNKIVISSERKLSEIKKTAGRLTNPYQIVFLGASLNTDYISDVIKTVTEKNMFTTLEIVFFEPEYEVDVDFLIKSVKLKRPQFLDNDLRLQYNESGNRSALFTVVSKREELFFFGEMKRQVYLWDKTRLPTEDDLEKLTNLEAVLIDTESNDIDQWIDDAFEYADDNFFISFKDHKLHRRLLELTSADEYVLDLLP